MPRRDERWEKQARAAILDNDLQALAALRPAVKANSNVRARTSVSVFPLPALMLAIEKKAHVAARWLLENSVKDKVDISKIDVFEPWWQTPLMAAVRVGDVKMARILIPFCDANAVNFEGDNALMCAFVDRNEGMAVELLPFCDAKRRRKDGTTALMHGVDLGPEDLQALLRKSDPLAECDNGDTALIWAARGGHAESAAILLPASDPAHRNKNGKIAFDCATERNDRNHWAVLDLLAETTPREKVDKVFKEAGAEKMPRWAARIEAEALRKVIGASKPDPDLENPQQSNRSEAKPPRAAKRV